MGSRPAKQQTTSLKLYSQSRLDYRLFVLINSNFIRHSHFLGVIDQNRFSSNQRYASTGIICDSQSQGL
jgi:hypothetical protein